MEMTRFEKRFVNRDTKVRRNIEAVRGCLADLPVDEIHDVLELGCGIGGVAAFLASECGANVCGTDYDQKQVSAAKELHPETDHLHFQAEDATHLSFEDGAFDLVVSQDVFHHIGAWETAIGEIARVLTSHGHLIWIDLVYPRFVKQVLRPFVKQYGLYTWDDILQSLELAGLTPRRASRDRHGMFGYGEVVAQKA